MRKFILIAAAISSFSGCTHLKNEVVSLKTIDQKQVFQKDKYYFGQLVESHTMTAGERAKTTSYDFYGRKKEVTYTSEGIPLYIKYFDALGTPIKLTKSYQGVEELVCYYEHY